MRAVLLLSLAAACAVSAPALAAGPTPWLGLSGSWNVYAMDDVNRDIRNFNSEIAGSGFSMDEINSGAGFGVSAGVDLGSSVTLGVGYERLGASTDMGAGGASFTYRHPGNAFRALGEYRLPTAGPLGARVGVALGVVSDAGSIEFSVPGFGGERVDLSGSGPLFEGYLSGEWQAAPLLSLVASAGYRHAKVGKVEASGMGVTGTVTNLDGSNYTVDYSGPRVSLGFRLSLKR